MNIRRSLTALTLAAGSLIAAAPAFAGTHGYGPPPPATPVMARPVVNPIAAQFAARRATTAYANLTRARLAQLRMQLRTDVARGRVRVAALPAFNSGASRVEVALRIASRDGIIAGPEQARINSMVDGLSRLDDQYRARGFGRLGAHR
jgi:hypothetical protein